MTIMQRIDQLCSERGWTLYELSNRANIAVCTLYSCKKKEREPTNEILKKICKAFGITLFQFYQDAYIVPEFTEQQRRILKKAMLLNEKELSIIEQLQDALIASRQGANK